MDPTLKGDQTTAIVISVVYRSCAIPVAWRIHRATQRRVLDGPHGGTAQGTGPGGSQGYDRHRALRPGHIQPQAVAADTRSGLASLYAVPEEHHLLRRRRQTIACPRLRLRSDTAWIGRGTAFGPPTAQRRCTLLAVWYAEQGEPWIILTDLPPEDAGPSWYALRFWIELGFKAIKSLGWKWDKTRRTDPARISRHWLVLSVATLLALAYGTRVEDAQDRRIAPGSLRAPPKALAPNHRDPRSRPARTVSAIRYGIDWLRRLLLKGRLWSRVWLLPEPWPQPKPNLEVTHHAPP